MAKRWINLSEDDLERWDNTPLLERKMIINKALRKHHEIEDFNPEKGRLKLEKLTEKHRVFDSLKGYIEDIETDLWDQMCLIEVQLESLEDPARGYSPPSIDAQQFWDIFLESAKRHHDEDIVFDSATGRSTYRIENIVDGKVMVERIDSKSPKPSTFTFATVEKALSRLKKSGGEWIQVGKFMPVLAQECAMVEIHPQLTRVELDEPTFRGAVIAYTEVVS
jgi:hypothetical protein